MTIIQKHPRITAVALIAFAAMLVIGGYALYLGAEAGVLPWQEEPTRIAITPFAGIPGFNGAASAATPVP